MSGGWYDKLAQAFDNTKEWDPITPELIEGMFKNDSRAMESLGSRWNIGQLERDAQFNQDKPSQGLARAATATGLGFLGAGAGSAFQGAGAASEATAASELAAQEALNSAQFAGQQGLLGAEVPQGYMSGMEAGMLDTGYTPSSLWNAAKYGPDSGQSFGQTMGNYGQGLLSKATSPGARQSAGQRFAMDQGMKMMQPQQPQMAPSRPYGPPQKPPPPVYGQQDPFAGMSEEEKQKLRAMGYPVPY